MGKNPNTFAKRQREVEKKQRRRSKRAAGGQERTAESTEWMSFVAPFVGAR